MKDVQNVYHSDVLINDLNVITDAVIPTKDTKNKEQACGSVQFADVGCINVHTAAVETM